MIKIHNTHLLSNKVKKQLDISQLQECKPLELVCRRLSCSGEYMTKQAKNKYLLGLSMLQI